MICPNCNSNNIVVKNIQTSYNTYQAVAICQNCGTQGVIGQGLINQEGQNYDAVVNNTYSKAKMSTAERTLRNVAAILFLIVFLVFILVIKVYSGSNVDKNAVNEVTTKVDKVKGIDFDGRTVTVPNGELLSIIQTNDFVVVKVKIEHALSNKYTIEQNYWNIEKLVNSYGFDEYSKIDYWAVADMVGGDERKVIAFEVPQSTMRLLKDGEIYPVQLGNCVENLYILPSLLEE